MCQTAAVCRPGVQICASTYPAGVTVPGTGQIQNHTRSLDELHGRPRQDMWPCPTAARPSVWWKVLRWTRGTSDPPAGGGDRVEAAPLKGTASGELGISDINLDFFFFIRQTLRGIVLQHSEEGRELTRS